MIYSRFGSELTLVSRRRYTDGGVSIQATVQGATDLREYDVGELKADAGLDEINQAVEKLPWKVLQKKVRRFQ